LVNQRAHDRDALSFAAGKLAGPMVQPFAKSDTFQQTFGALFRAVICRAIFVCQSGHEDVFPNGAVRQQMVRLKNETNLAVANLGERAFVLRAEFLIAKPDPTGIR
jgi:hypothetical protein